MLTRIITALVALAVFVAVLMAPPIVFTVALAAVVFVMLWECYSATKADKLTGAVGFVSAALLMLRLYFNADTMLCLAVIMTLYMILAVIKHGKKDYEKILSSAFLTLYVVISMGIIWQIKEEKGILAMLLPFICAWSADTFAYFTGSLCGRHKLIPNVSPKKTVEGAVGGVVGAAVVCAVYVHFTNITGISAVMGIIFGLVGSVISQLGDLAASAIKRDAEIKDFGWIFPGHGGFMDRFDSVMLVSLWTLIFMHILQIVA